MVCKGWTVATTSTPYTPSFVPRPKATQKRVDYITVTSVEKAYQVGDETRYTFSIYSLRAVVSRRIEPAAAGSDPWFASRVLVCDTLQNLSKGMDSS